ncbi:MAG: hypothetical protein H0W72_15070 [Planctomycetes bacterium]|nr:hypothetical protein [Planctomycetota bacterium]
MHHRGAGWTPTSVREHYLGIEEPGAQDLSGSTDEHEDAPNLGAREFATLLDVAHMHLVAMPMILFIVAHLFSMAPLGRARWAGALCYLSFGFALVDILAPFAIRFWSPAFAWPKLIAFIGLEVSLLTMTLATLAAGLATFARRTTPDEPVP